MRVEGFAPYQTASQLELHSEYHVSITGLRVAYDQFDYVQGRYVNLSEGAASITDVH